ncbi:MAG: hypothetical protein HY808_03095 [Nitrospirae bacterium]|nr:hypothetical protein [Nitrospirota bacterium]
MLEHHLKNIYQLGNFDMTNPDHISKIKYIIIRNTSFKVTDEEIRLAWKEFNKEESIKVQKAKKRVEKHNAKRNQASLFE